MAIRATVIYLTGQALALGLISRLHVKWSKRKCTRQFDDYMDSCRSLQQLVQGQSLM